MKVYHYVYYSFEPWGRGYIGVRSSNCQPEDDFKYLGSFKDKTFNPSEKIILSTFKTRKEANEAEIFLHNFYEVHINPHFANKAKHTSSSFCVAGIPKSDEHKKKIALTNSRVLKGKPSTFKGKTHSTESRKKISESKKGRNLSEEHKEKLRRASTGFKHSEESKQKMSKAQKGRVSPMKGRKTSEETKRKQSEVKKGRVFSEEHKRRLSEARKGKEPWNKGKSLKSNIRKSR